jgi:molecular chaperone GrpE (heat shock protein)
VLEFENANSKKLVEKKNLIIESLQQSAEQESNELKNSLKDLKSQLKSKSAELQVFKAKYDRELSVLNEKAK